MTKMKRALPVPTTSTSNLLLLVVLVAITLLSQHDVFVVAQQWNGNGGAQTIGPTVWTTRGTDAPTDGDTGFVTTILQGGQGGFQGGGTNPPAVDIEVDYDICYVCGDADNNYMKNLDAIVPLPGGQGSPPDATFPVNCADLYTDGINGDIPTNSCGLITQLSILPCGCMPPDFTCSVCGFGGYTVQAPAAQLTIPTAGGEAETNCGDLEVQGATGQLTPAECVAAADAIIFSNNTCGCALNPELAIEFPTCNICESDNLVLGNETKINAALQPSTPEVVLLLSDSDVNATCGELYAAGLANGLGTGRCRAAQLQAVDNCQCAPGPPPPTVPAVLPVTVLPETPGSVPATGITATAPAPAPGPLTIDAPVSEEGKVPPAGTLVDPTASNSNVAIGLEAPIDSAAALCSTTMSSIVVVVVVGMLVVVL
mmetsp:Transcript_41134/g.46433  ORF Transcript_41134/g.46433 Transcript_41134/m.46433 type:complete len:427 (+) Transcript_41134:248-1528(+)